MTNQQLPQNPSASVLNEPVTLLDVKGTLHEMPEPHYVDYFFDVPAGASKVGMRLTFPGTARLLPILYDPQRFRGHCMFKNPPEPIVVDLWVGEGDASEGGLPGPLPAGTWRATVNVRAVRDVSEYRLEAYAEFDHSAPTVTLPAYPADYVSKAQAGWYCGELHAHSTESDGEYPVETVVKACKDLRLDYLSLTDHFTSSQWRKLGALISPRLAFIRSTEITSLWGHANLHGIEEWVDVFVDRPGWDINQAADAVHAQGGLFCINHATNIGLGWRHFNFDWDKADMMEVFHNLEGASNNVLPQLWDMHLNMGRRVVGVGGIDSHNPFTGLHKLGQVVTWVYAQELSEKGIIEGLRRGRVYISRGPQLLFTATDAKGASAEMWESLEVGKGPITLTVEVQCHEPLRVVVVKDGYPFESKEIVPRGDERLTVTFDDKPQRPCFYRVELHSIFSHELQPKLKWRDFTTMRAMSNPIWVGWQQFRAGWERARPLLQ